jgi:hypothetical protein
MARVGDTPQEVQLIRLVPVGGHGVRRRGGGTAEIVKKVLAWASVAFLIFFIAYRPENAAAVFKSLGNTLVDIATGVGSFFSSLVA